MKLINGFSRLNKNEKYDWIAQELGLKNGELKKFLEMFSIKDSTIQNTFDSFSENTIGNFHLPFGVVPNMIINKSVYTLPMVIEESSVVAAVGHTAKFWSSRGGFKAQVISTIKVGHIHFMWKGESHRLKSFFKKVECLLKIELVPFTRSMDKRGGGIVSIALIDRTKDEPNYYQIEMKFETCDAMGANFINTVLEETSKILQTKALEDSGLIGHEKNIDVIMCILSNYTPECLVRSSVECPISELGQIDNFEFSRRFIQAVKIAEIDISRATTHNKGIMNGIDAICLATGNDFRAIESCLHTYACRTGTYRSLTQAKIQDETLFFEITIPLSLGTVGGLTKLHPMAKFSLDLLGRPSSQELMQIVASVGLAQNFAALRALITTGIQKGHMKMHLSNILDSHNIDAVQKESAIEYFSNKMVSVSAVRDFIQSLSLNLPS